MPGWTLVPAVRSGAVPVAAPPSLPAGVTLQAIDGETMLTTTTMSNNYYSRNGFTYASSNATYTTVNWDSKSFFPIMCFFGLFTGDMAIFVDLGLNVASPATGGSDLALMATNNVQGFNGFDQATHVLDNNANGDWLISYHMDEPAAVADIQYPMVNTGAEPRLNAAGQAGRMWDVSTTVNQIVGGDIGGTPMSTVVALNNFNKVGGGTRSIDLLSNDIYWFAGAGDTTVNPALMGVLTQPMAFTGTGFTADQMKRGSHYGNMVDVMRSWANGTNTGNGDGMIGKSGAASRIPLRPYIENHNGNFNEASDLILPTELNWAVWSQLIHGARMIDYFVYSGIQTGGGITSQGFATNIIAGQSISIYNQAKATNALIKSLASQLNSPFAKGFVTVSPSGYVFPTPASGWLNGGIECCAKWDSSNFYIFATTRYGEAQGSTLATFTIKHVAGTTQVSVINESRNISLTINGGGAGLDTFADTFTNPWDVHIYKVN